MKKMFSSDKLSKEWVEIFKNTPDTMVSDDVLKKLQDLSNIISVKQLEI